MSCLCIDELAPASFRGVPFYVKSDTGHFGRRIATHEYPMRDIPYNEDLGEKAPKFSVTGYIVGDSWIAQKDALKAACRMRGPSLLQLPAESPTLVVCNDIKITRKRDECGYFECVMDFTGAGAGVFSIPLGAFEAMIGGVLSSAIAPLTLAYDVAYTVGGVLDYVRDSQIGRILTFANDVVGVTLAYPSVNAAITSDVIQAASVVYQAASAFASPDRSTGAALCALPAPSNTIAFIGDSEGRIATNSSGSGVTVKSGACAVVPVVADLINSLGNSLSPDDAVTALTALAAFSVGEVSLAQLQNPIPTPLKPLTTLASAPVSPSDTVDAVNGTLFCGVVRSFALIKLAQAMATKTFTTRADAIQSRANLVELFNSQLQQFDEDTLVDAVVEARDLAVTAITQQMATLVPVVTVSAPQSMPSLYWASRLYQDVGRAEELADRNGASYPAFMPTIFEALSA